MSIIASAPVPAHSRLADAETVEQPRITNDLTVINAEIDRITLATMGRTLPPANPEPDPALLTRSPLCPPWCSGTCADVDHFTNGGDAYHHRNIIEVTAAHGDFLSEQRWVDVDLEASEDVTGIEPTSIRLSVGEPDGPTSDSAKLTPEQAEQLGLALLQAARLARRGGRG